MVCHCYLGAWAVFESFIWGFFKLVILGSAFVNIPEENHLKKRTKFDDVTIFIR